MLPGKPASPGVHRVSLLENDGRVGCEIRGPARTTRWWFTPGRNGLDVETVSPSGKVTRHPVWAD